MLPGQGEKSVSCRAEQHRTTAGKHIMKIGIMLMSDRGPDGQPTDWRGALAEWKSHGLEAVDLFDSMLQATGETIDGARKLLGGLGLEPSMYCVRTDLVSSAAPERAQSLDTVRRGIEACCQLGITQLLSYGAQHNNEGNDAVARYVDGLQHAADLCAGQGITLSIENAGRMCHTPAELKRCVDMVNRPNMKITFDGGNFILAGCDSHAAVDLLAKDIVHVHVKSFVPAPDLTPRPYRYCPTGEGSPDYRYIRDVLMRAGFDGCMSFEPEGGHDSKWTQSLDTLTRIVNEVRCD